jgi:N-acetylmuramoyl-L-alanine amidase
VNVRILFLVMALAGTACASGSKSDKSAGSSSSSTSVAPVSSSTEGGAATTGPTSPSSTAATTGTSGASSTTAKPAATSPTAPDHRVAASGAFLAGERGAAVAADPGGKVTGRIRAGVAMAVDAIEGGWAHVLTPCENHLWVKTSDGRIEQTADIVLDPGHGGPEAGAVGPAGLTEKELNLAVAQMTVEALADQGVTAALTRTGDYRQTLASRVAVATAMHPRAFVSIHHNAEPDEQRSGPGTETYYQVGKSVTKEKSADSKRLAGLIYEEVVKALSAYSATWVADRDAGAKYRVGDSGDDYYGILRRAAANGVVASLAELAFISNPSEEALLQRDDVRRAEAGAVARGIVRWLHNESSGNVFVVPYPRTEPAGGGGGTEGCVDPA